MKTAGINPRREINVLFVGNDLCVVPFINQITVPRVICVPCVICNGIVHRDIKPENIIISDEGRVVLIDLNISRKISANTKDTVVMGTVGYASPEQLGITQSDPRTDIYALGILLNVMLTGKHPSEILARGKAKKIVKICTAINPKDRYQSVKELANSL